MEEYQRMEEQQKELLALVGELAEKYTSKDSTSISYETAQMLMEAVVYCVRQEPLREMEQEREEAAEGITAGCAETKMVPEAMETPKLRAAYERGCALVMEKVLFAKKLYEELLPLAMEWDEPVGRDMILREVPLFFLQYDAKFCPQDAKMLFLYPVREDLNAWQGVDRVIRYLLCIREELRET